VSFSCLEDEPYAARNGAFSPAMVEAAVIAHPGAAPKMISSTFLGAEFTVECIKNELEYLL
jgi:hypothetical protein